MKKSLLLLLTLMLCLAVGGCAAEEGAASLPEEPSKLDSIPFQDGQLYAVAYLGYQEIEDIAPYLEKYLDSDQIPVHYLSNGDYYLIIPRYADTTMYLYQNDMETSESTIIFEDPDCQPFIVQCNVSDIFPDATIHLTCEEGVAEFSPYISLMDGSVVVGQDGLDLSDTAA